MSSTYPVSCYQGPTPLSKQEVEQLLKKGAYGSLMEDDKAGDQFCEEDIDQILQRRTQVITIESVGKGSTFAKVRLVLITVESEQVSCVWYFIYISLI